MKTFSLTLLKIGAVALVFWLVLHHAPVIAAPLVGALAIAVLLTIAFCIALFVGLSVGLAVVVALLVAVFALAAVLAPIWLPILAIVGLVALCRPKRRTTA